MAYLTLSLRDREVSKHPLSGNMRIGRDPSNDLVIDNVGVSRHHATLNVSQGNQFSIKDAGSQNGVFVNGRRIDERQLVDGDVIQIGKYTLEFSSMDRPMPKPLIAQPKASPGAGRGHLKTFALDDGQLQQMLASGKRGAAIQVPAPAAPAPAAGPTAVAPRPVGGVPDHPDQPHRPHVSTQHSYVGQAPEPAPFADGAVGAPVGMPAVVVQRKAQPISPVLWVALGLTALCVIVGVLVL
jgi:predicted component of type VI protein secretion system